jgi:hypothetical protein
MPNLPILDEYKGIALNKEKLASNKARTYCHRKWGKSVCSSWSAQCAQCKDLDKSKGGDLDE